MSDRDSSQPADRTGFRPMILALVVLLAAGGLSLLSLRPPAPLPATAPDSVFAAGRAWRHVEVIAREPHPTGSEAHDRVRAYLVQQLEQIGVDARADVSTMRVRGRDGGERVIVLRNIVAVLPGTDPTGAVALVTHYDSHPRAPGAGDDGLAVSAVLEAARVLRGAPPLRNDLVLLFTDGEELGLLGAQSFLASDPAAAAVRVVINLEGRGSHGPVLMFETGPGNAALVRIFHRADPHPIASSLFPEAYKYLPNDTDFTVFLAAGIRGLNFAHIGHAETYHQPTDLPVNASPATLQHHGAHAVAMARAFGDIDLGTLPGPESGDAVFFNVAGVGLIRYPAAFAVPHGFAVLALWLVAVVLGRRGGIRLLGVGAGFGYGVFALLVCAVAAWGAALVAAREEEAGTLTAKLVTSEVPYMLALIAVAVALVLAVPATLRQHERAVSVVLGMLLLPVLIGVAAAVLAPGASYLFLWPAACAIAATWLAARTPQSTRRGAVIGTGLLVPAVVLWAPHLSLFLTGLSFNMAPALGAIAGVAALTLAPVALLRARAVPF